MNWQTVYRKLFDLKPENRHCRFQVLFFSAVVGRPECDLASQSGQAGS
jgi:hypothetical protein